MGMRHQSTFCNILLKYKTKPWNLGRKRKSSCQMLPNECSIMNPTYLRKKCPLLNRLFPKITSDWNSNNVSHPYQIFAFFFFFFERQQTLLTFLLRTWHSAPCSTDCQTAALHADFSFVNWDLEYFHGGKADQWFFKRAKQFRVMNIS